VAHGINVYLPVQSCNKFSLKYVIRTCPKSRMFLGGAHPVPPFLNDILAEALPFVQKFQGKTVVIKYGGAAMKSEVLKNGVIKDLVLLSCVGLRLVFMHGGGPEINEWLARAGIRPQFKNGPRFTEAPTMGVVEMVLVDKAIVDNGSIPVIASVAADDSGKVYNINVDNVTREIAAYLGAESSCFAERQRTLAIVKPDGMMGNHSEEINTIILAKGFVIVTRKLLQLDQAAVRNFYAEHSQRDFFHSLMKFMTSGPVLAMILEKEDAVAQWRALIGPTDARTAKISHPQSIRALCGLDSEKNCIHGSDSCESAAREISFFFGDDKS
ncbi:hypothetical protein KI387_019766, partial [Taxus chinensis]